MRLALVLLVACGGAAPPPAQPIANTAPPPPAPVAAPGLAITAIEPDKGDIDGGTYVRLRGHGFIEHGPRSAKIYFGNRQGEIVRFASDTELIAEAPGGKVGEVVDVLVMFEPGGELKLPHAFTFVEKHPITISP